MKLALLTFRPGDDLRATGWTICSDNHVRRIADDPKLNLTVIAVVRSSSGRRTLGSFEKAGRKIRDHPTWKRVYDHVGALAEADQKNTHAGLRLHRRRHGY